MVVAEVVVEKKNEQNPLTHLKKQDNKQERYFKGNEMTNGSMAMSLRTTGGWVSFVVFTAT